VSGVGLSAADRNRKIRQDALREQLSNQKLVEQVVDIAKKIGDLSQDFEKDKIDRLKIAADLNMKLVAKYLPDLKQTELIGDPDKPIGVSPIQWTIQPVKPVDAKDSKG
jgi:hypothetical protein